MNARPCGLRPRSCGPRVDSVCRKAVIRLFGAFPSGAGACAYVHRSYPPHLWMNCFPMSVPQRTLGPKDTTNRSAPDQGAGTPIRGLAGRAKDTTNLMNTIDATSDNRPAPTCPTCGEHATNVGHTLNLNVITANCICRAGHLWLTRWMAA